MNEVLRDIKFILDKASPCDINPFAVKNYDEQVARLKAVKSYPITWIPCGERLPSETGTYLVTTAKGKTYWDRFYADTQSWGHENAHKAKYKANHIAWMPLPVPYESELGDE